MPYRNADVHACTPSACSQPQVDRPKWRSPHVLVSAPESLTHGYKVPSRHLAAEILGVPARRLATHHTVMRRRGERVSHDQWFAGIDDLFRTMTGLVVLLRASESKLTAGVEQEIAAARRLGLPILVVTLDGDIAPASACVVRPRPCGPPPAIRKWNIVVPEGGAPLSQVVAALDAMHLTSTVFGSAAADPR